VPQHLDEAHHGDIANMREQATTGRRHMVPAQAEALDVRPQRAQPL
jgi:hypothetical protein